MNDDGSIYSPPAADLTIEEELPEEYIGGTLTRRKLLFLAWLSLIYLVLTIPTIAVSFMSEFYGGSGGMQSLNTSLTVINLLVYIYSMIMFRIFLNLRFNYSGVNTHIFLLIALSLTLNVSSLLMGDDFGVSMVVFVLSLVPFGIVSIMFGKRLLTIQTEFSYLKLYSWATIIAGILMTTVIFMVLALPAAIVASFGFMMMFFTAAGEKKAQAG
jgi:hypothetical protein